MRLSEAIRKGSVGMEQVFGPVYRYGSGSASDDGSEIIGCCAIGAALRGTGRRHGIDDLHLFVEVPANFGRCPACDSNCSGNGVVHATTATVIHLNEDHHWTFEQIADWAQAQEAIHGIGQDENAIQCEALELIEA